MQYWPCVINGAANNCILSWFIVSSKECVSKWTYICTKQSSVELRIVWSVSECHIVIANNPSQWILYQISGDIGLVPHPSLYSTIVRSISFSAQLNIHAIRNFTLWHFRRTVNYAKSKTQQTKKWCKLLWDWRENQNKPWTEIMPWLQFLFLPQNKV